jgi:hypothetical protein
VNRLKTLFCCIQPRIGKHSRSRYQGVITPELMRIM